MSRMLSFFGNYFYIKYLLIVFFQRYWWSRKACNLIEGEHMLADDLKFWESNYGKSFAFIKYSFFWILLICLYSHTMPGSSWQEQPSFSVVGHSLANQTKVVVSDASIPRWNSNLLMDSLQRYRLKNPEFYLDDSILTSNFWAWIFMDMRFAQRKLKIVRFFILGNL